MTLWGSTPSKDCGILLLDEVWELIIDKVLDLQRNDSSLYSAIGGEVSKLHLKENKKGKKTFVKKWEINLTINPLFRSNFPPSHFVLHDSLYFANFSYLYSINTNNGEIRWKKKLSYGAEAAAISIHRFPFQFLVVACRGYIAAHSFETGKTLWKNQLSGAGFGIVNMSLSHDTIYCVCNGHAFAIGLDGSTKWHNSMKKTGTDAGACLYINGYLVVAICGKFITLSIDKGKIMKETVLTSSPSTFSITSWRHFVVLGGNWKDVLTCIDPKNHKIIWKQKTIFDERYSLDSRTKGFSFNVSDDYIYAGTDTFIGKFDPKKRGGMVDYYDLSSKNIQIPSFYIWNGYLVAGLKGILLIFDTINNNSSQNNNNLSNSKDNKKRKLELIFQEKNNSSSHFSFSSITNHSNSNECMISGLEQDHLRSSGLLEFALSYSGVV